MDVHLTKTSGYLGWDITCLGLPRSEQPFKHGSFSQLNRVFCDEKLIYHDRMAIKPSNNIQHHAAGLNSHSVVATFIAYAPENTVSDEANKALIDSLRALMVENHASKKVSITQIRQLLVIRYLGEHAEECKAYFILLWQKIRPVYLAKEANIPRVWHT